MEGFLLDVGKTFVEKWITGAIEKSRYLFCFKSIAREFNEEKDKLEADTKTMRQRFRVAIEKDKDIPFNAQFWEERAEKLIQEDTKTNQRCFFGFCPNCIWRYKRGKELANKIEEIKNLVEKGEKFENIELARRLPDVERLLKQGRKIANKCKGLPVAIATIASSLKGQKRQVEWDVALKSLKNPMSMGDVDDTLVDIYKCLKFSYDNLNDKKAKELFLLCSVFQEDEEISTEILTRLGIGVGLFGEGYDKYNDARNLVVVAKNKLLDSCLLLKTKKRDVKMHDLIREAAHWIANKEILVVDSSNKNQKSSFVGRDNNIRYLLVEGNSMDLCSSGFDSSKLNILIFIVEKGCFVDSFFENIAGLRVLNLIAGEKITLSLPQSIQSLTNIRSLLIERVNLGDISVLGSLQSLETLDLNNCSIEELPQEIAELKKLRLLNLEECLIERNNPFKVIQRCPSLEELYFRNSFNKFCLEITLPTFERYQLIEWSYYGEMMYDFSLSKCVTLQHDYLSEATFKHVIQTAEILKLERIKKGWKNLMPEIVPIDHGMNDLIELRLGIDSSLQCLIDTKHIGSQVPNVFSNLVVLELILMKNLKELCNGPISSDSLNNLEELSIKDCEDLGSLFKYSLKLCNLKTVTLTSCSTLVSVFDLSTSQSLLLLERLVINKCKQLENIFTNERKSYLPVDGDNDNNKSCNTLFPKLESINIIGCYNLKHIFGQHQDVELASLKTLLLTDVPNIIEMFPESSFEGSSHSISKPQTQLEVAEPIKSNRFPWSHVCCYGYKYKLRGSSSSTNTKIPSPSVNEDQPQHCSISLEWYCLLRLSHVMCNIKEINLDNVSKIKSVFMLSISLKMLSLERLCITNCGELEHIVVDIGDGSGTGVNIVFPKLKKLEVYSCMKLKYIFGHINASDHHHENHLHIPALKCLQFYNLPSLIDMGTKNYHITLPHLVELILLRCPQVDNKSIGDFVYSMSKSHDNTTIKDLSGSDLEAHLAVENLRARDSKFQYIFYLDEINGQQRNLRTCFPKLRTISVRKCNKLKYVLPSSMCTELPKLWLIVIGESAKLEKIFGGSEVIVGRFPNLNFIVFVELPSLFEGIHFQTVQHRLVHNCQNLSSTSTPTHFLSTLGPLDYDLIVCLSRLTQQIKEHSKTKEDTSGGILNDTEIGSDSKKMQLVSDLKQKDTKLSFEDGDSQEKPQTNNQVEPSKEESEEASRHELTSSQELMNPQQSVAEIDTTGKPSQDNNLEGSTSGKTAAGTMSTISETKNEPTIQLDTIALKQKGIETSVKEGTTSNNDKTIPSSTHLEDGDGKISIPSFLTSTKPAATKYADIGDSHETIAMEDINKMIEEDPLLALEKLLTGQVSISSIRVLIQELKTLMDSSSDIEHLVSNQESKSKLISIFHQLSQHQGMLTSDMKDFVEKVQNFFNEIIIKHATLQQVFKKHNQLLDSKTDLVNKLWSAKSTQTHIDGETSTANAQIHELSLQIDEHRKKMEDLENQRDGLKSVVNKCDVQKKKLNAECTEWAEQSKELLSALASSEVDIKEAEHAMNLAKEGFANLKSSFPTF
ncbi:putative disease resistance protein [Trifolium repens]|nr:putative disease resistance protein [Trifolium repens]